MRITISCEPTHFNDADVIMRIKLDGLFGETKYYERAIIEDWFTNESIFERVILSMAKDLQSAYLKEKAKP